MGPSPVWMGEENLAPAGIRYPDRGVDIVKIKFTLEKATKAQRGSRGVALLFL